MAICLISSMHANRQMTLTAKIIAIIFIIIASSYTEPQLQNLYIYILVTFSSIIYRLCYFTSYGHNIIIIYMAWRSELWMPNSRRKSDKLHACWLQNR